MVSYASLSKNGSREINEDSIATRSKPAEQYFFVLADGLGGHGQGEVASAMAVEGACAVFSENQSNSEEMLRECMKQAQSSIREEIKRQGLKDELKTTLNLLYMDGVNARWAHVGDSRLYLFKKSKYILRTLDHSVPQMLVSQGEIREQDIRNHEDRNRLIRVLGMEQEIPRFDLSEPLRLEDGMVFLLCSDGFWELIEEKDMMKYLKRANTPEEWLQAMEQTVLRNGHDRNMDNYSAIAVFV